MLELLRDALALCIPTDTGEHAHALHSPRFPEVRVGGGVGV